MIGKNYVTCENNTCKTAGKLRLGDRLFLRSVLF